MGRHGLAPCSVVHVRNLALQLPRTGHTGVRAWPVLRTPTCTCSPGTALHPAGLQVLRGPVAGGAGPRAKPTSAEVHVLGEIVGASGFSFPELFCRWARMGGGGKGGRGPLCDASSPFPPLDGCAKAGKARMHASAYLTGGRLPPTDLPQVAAGVRA